MNTAALRLALIAVVGAAGACKRGAGTPPPPPRPVLGQVTVRDVTPPEESAGAALDASALERELRDRLRATGFFGAEADAGGGPPIPVTRARAEVAVDSAEVGAKGVVRARVRITMDTRPSDAPGAISEQLEGQGDRQYAVGAGAAVPAELVRRVMADLLGGFAARRRLQSGPPEVVHVALTSPDASELRVEAIQAAGARQLREEVPTLLKLLHDPDEATRDAALGALIAMRERRAVSELTRTRSLRDRREMRKILEAISILGGQEAEEYLSFVAETHDDEDIRGVAVAARKRLERRAGDAPNRP